MDLVAIIGLVSAVFGIVTFVYFFLEKRPKRKIHWKSAERYSELIVKKLAGDGYMPSLIFGIGRGGAIFGAMISGAMGHCPLIVIDRKYEWSEKGRIEDIILPINMPEKLLTHVLLVAGEVHSGSTMHKYFDYLKYIGSKNIRRAVLLYENGCPFNVEYIGMKSEKANMLLPWMFSKGYLRADRNPSLPKDSDHTIRIHFVRHAQSVTGEEIFAGSTDVELSVNGIEQSLSVGRTFIGKNISCIYTSPLKRSVITAKIINSYVPNAECKLSEALREIDFGVWEGHSHRDVKKQYPHDFMKWEEDPAINEPPNGEKAQVALDRILAFLDDLVLSHKVHECADIVVVTHKTIIRILLSYLNGEKLGDYRNRMVDNCEAITIAFNGKRWCEL